jgi:hypothetical protein
MRVEKEKILYRYQRRSLTSLCYKLAAALTAALIVPTALMSLPPSSSLPPLLCLFFSLLFDNAPHSPDPETLSGLNDIVGQPVTVR